MDTLKTGFIVVLLLAVLYGVYVVLNKDQTPPTAEIAWHQQEAEKDLQIEIGPPIGISDDAPPSESPAVLGSSSKTAAVGAPPTATTENGLPTVLKAQLSAPPPSTLPAAATEPAMSASAPALKSAEEEPKPSVAAPNLLATTSESAAGPASAETKPAGTPTEIGPLPSLREIHGTPSTPPASATSLSSSPTEVGAPSPDTANSLTATPGKSTDADTSVAGSAPPSVPISSPLKDAVETSPVPDAPLSENTKIDIQPVTTTTALAAALREAQANIAAEQWYQALFLLSKFYGSTDLTSQQQQDLIDMLDPLAAKVVYSPEHLVADPHEVQRGETLAQIADKHQVPPQLLANINGLQNPDLLVPGTKLKIVRGPFRASVELERKELTLFAGQLYAGRFPISVGRDPEPIVGEYRVLEKQPGKVYYAGGGQTIAPEDPHNPFGRVWIGLGKELAIHGSAEQGETGSMGCISLSPLDAQDVYGILSQGSSVIIRR